MADEGDDSLSFDDVVEKYGEDEIVKIVRKWGTPLEKKKGPLVKWTDLLKATIWASLAGLAFTLLPFIGAVAAKGFSTAWDINHWRSIGGLWLGLGPTVFLVSFVLLPKGIGMLIDAVFTKQAREAAWLVVGIGFVVGVPALLMVSLVRAGYEDARNRDTRPAAVKVVKEAVESQRKTTEAIHETLANEQPDVAQLKEQVAKLADQQKATGIEIERLPKDNSNGFLYQLLSAFIAGVAVLVVEHHRKIIAFFRGKRAVGKPSAKRKRIA